MQRESFGLRLMIDGYGSPKECLVDLDLIYEYLNQLPEIINMTKIMPPYVFKYKGVVPEDWGLSGVVLIAESHLTVHTFPDKGYISLDVYSCKNFNYIIPIEFARKLFCFTKEEVYTCKRGLEFGNITIGRREGN